jgi:hypothetical protein
MEKGQKFAHWDETKGKRTKENKRTEEREGKESG